MRVLLTQREMIIRSGSELFTIEVAKELSERGHEVAIFCPRIGDLAGLVYSSGVRVKSRLMDLPWRPDVVHGQHHLQAMAAMAYYDDAPGVYFCHGIKPWVERVPLHPRIASYLVTCPWMALRIEAESGVDKQQIAIVPNFVNLRRFSRIRRPPVRPKRAVLFGGKDFSRAQLRELESACASVGLSFDALGRVYGNPVSRPEVALLDYDLVFAIGKCALEALACGCAVIPILPGHAGNIIDPSNFETWSFSNFSPRYFTSASQVTADWLREELARYSAEAILEVSEKVRRENELCGAVDKLENVYKGAVERFSENPGPHKSEFAAYLETIASETESMWIELRRARKKIVQQHTSALPMFTWFKAKWRALKIGIARNPKPLEQRATKAPPQSQRVFPTYD
jgi:hypothetical protein